MVIVLDSTERWEQPWQQGGVRVFLSHSAEAKEQAAELRDALQRFGMAAFVAHEDIAPAEDWQNMILKALGTMQMMILLLTPRFQESAWTNQEVGFALCNKTPIMPIRMGIDPPGFLGKYQSSSGMGKPVHEIAEDTFRVLLSDDKHKDMGTEAFVAAVESSDSWNNSNHLAGSLNLIKVLSPEQEAALVRAYNENREVTNAFDFIRKLPAHLSRVTGRTYEIVQNDDGTRTIQERHSF